MGKAKTPKSAGRWRMILARNLSVAIAVSFADAPDKPMAVAKKAGVSKSTVQRVLAGATGPSLDTIEKITDALGIPLHVALDPAFAEGFNLGSDLGSVNKRRLRRPTVSS